MDPRDNCWGRQTTITTTDHTPYKSQQMVEEAHTTDNLSGQHQ